VARSRVVRKPSPLPQHQKRLTPDRQKTHYQYFEREGITKNDQ
jgi:hypothetical protein